MSKKVLLVDLDASSQEQCARVLRDCACEVSVFGSSAAAMAHLHNKPVDAMLVDVRLPGFHGSDLPTAARHAQPGIKIILLVENLGNPLPDGPLRLHGFPLLTKPLRIEQVARALEAAPEPPPAPPESAPTAPTPAPAEFAGLVGGSERMRKIYRLISKVALQRHPVLIMGESGTGKELVARAIHTHGPWHDQPYVPVDCGALPPTLIESELFGHVRGAFTGAAQPRQGLLAAAGSGTVFMDEIGELPIELQSRLLRTLEEHEIRPLGSNEPVKFDARIVAATNRNLQEGVKDGTFRQDLFFRLNVVVIKVPPLRERKEDIPALVRHFLARLADGKPALEVSDEILSHFLSYD